MKTHSAILVSDLSKPVISLHDLVNNVAESFYSAASRNRSFIVNDVPEQITFNSNKDLVASLLSGLMNVVILHSENSCIRITAKSYNNVVLLHVKDDGCSNYDSISSCLAQMQSMAERLGGFVGFTSYRNKLTTIAFSFMNRQGTYA